MTKCEDPLKQIEYAVELFPTVFSATQSFYPDHMELDQHDLVDVDERGGRVVRRYFAAGQFDVNLLQNSGQERGVNAVFDPHAESLFTACHIPSATEARRTAADLGAGSGILSVVAARRGWSVTAYEKNPEAARYSRINVLINECKANVQVRVEDWTKKTSTILTNSQLVLANVPFEPLFVDDLELQKNFPKHSAAGLLGDSVWAPLLGCARDLAVGGVMLMPMLGVLEPGKQESRFEEKLRETATSGVVTVVHLILSDVFPVSWYKRRYGKWWPKVKRAASGFGLRWEFAFITKQTEGANARFVQVRTHQAGRYWIGALSPDGSSSEPVSVDDRG